LVALGGWLLVGVAAGAALAGTELGIAGSRFTLNGRPTFLYGASYYGALGASREFIRRDLDDLQKLGFNWIRVWATWGMFDHDVSAVDRQGRPRAPFLERLQWLVGECDRRGMVVDVTLTRGRGAGSVGSLSGHQRAVETLARALRKHRNWYFDLANERNVRDARYVSMSELKQLRDAVKRLDARRLVTASQGGDINPAELRDYLFKARVDFIAPHRRRAANSPAQTRSVTRQYLARLRELGRVVPVHYQEPFRRGYSPRRWQPTAGAFVEDLRGALAGGAAGWCFHNGDQKDRPDGRPRRSFDLRRKRLFDQLDPVERKALPQMAAVMANHRAKSPAPRPAPSQPQPH
jgi:endo-1,4-beta-mannosidase